MNNATKLSLLIVLLTVMNHTSVFSSSQLKTGSLITKANAYQVTIATQLSTSSTSLISHFDIITQGEITYGVNKQLELGMSVTGRASHKSMLQNNTINTEKDFFFKAGRLSTKYQIKPEDLWPEVLFTSRLTVIEKPRLPITADIKTLLFTEWSNGLAFRWTQDPIISVLSFSYTYTPTKIINNKTWHRSDRIDISSTAYFIVNSDVSLFTGGRLNTKMAEKYDSTITHPDYHLISFHSGITYGVLTHLLCRLQLNYSRENTLSFSMSYIQE